MVGANIVRLLGGDPEHWPFPDRGNRRPGTDIGQSIALAPTIPKPCTNFSPKCAEFVLRIPAIGCIQTSRESMALIQRSTPRLARL
jgi:hypothetical protein